MKTALFLALMVLCVPARAESYVAIVADCHDGDTCKILKGEEIVRCRIASIDAPEMAFPGRWPEQPYAADSRLEIEAMVGGQTVYVVDHGAEEVRHGKGIPRHVCDLVAMVGGQAMNVGEAMVARGAAWAYPEFDRDDPLPMLEAMARQDHRGLWATPAVPPWRWRRGER